jgi:hypothetical protein
MAMRHILHNASIAGSAALLLVLAGTAPAAEETPSAAERAKSETEPPKSAIGGGGVYDSPGSVGQFEGKLLCVEREIGSPPPAGAAQSAPGCEDGHAVLRTEHGAVNLILSRWHGNLSELRGENVRAMGKYYEDLNAVFVADLVRAEGEADAPPVSAGD